MPYGNSAFLGVVNVVTKRGADIDGFYLSAHTGGYTNIAGGHGDKVDKSQDALAFGGGVITFGKKFENGGDLLLSATYHKDFGQVLYAPFWQATGAGGIADGFDFTEARYIFAKYNYQGLRFLGRFSDSEKGRLLGDYASTPNHEDNKSNDRAYFVEARHEHTWNASVNTMVRGYYDHTKFIGKWFYEGFSPLDVQTVPSDWFGTEAQVSWKARLGHVLAGFEYQNHTTSQTEDYPSEPLHETNEYRFSTFGIYLQDDIKLLDNMNLNLGGRYENDEDFGGIFVFRTSIAYLPITNTVVKLHYGDAFKNPLRHDFFYVGSDGQRNDVLTQLTRERIRTVELAATHVFSNSYKVDASLFYSKLDDLVTFEKRPEIASEKHYYNTAGVNSLGSEIEFKYSVTGILEGYLNGTYQRTTNAETKERVLNSPSYSVKLGSIFHTLPDEKLDIALEGQLYGKADYQDEFQQEAFSIFNLILTSKGIFYGLNLSLGIYNVLNQAYEYSLAKGIQQPPSANGRNFRLKVAGRL